MKAAKTLCKTLPVLLLAASTAFASPAVLEVTDHMRGMKYKTFDDNWSFSPVGKFGVSIVNSKEKRTLKIKKSFSKKLDDALAKKKTNIENGKESKLVSDTESVKVAGSLDAKGIVWENPTRETKAQELFFEHGGKVYEAQCESRKGGDFDTAKKECEQILAQIELLK